MCEKLILILFGCSSITFSTNSFLIAKNTPENILKLKKLTRYELAEEFSGQFEGDIIISNEQLREMSDLLKVGLYDCKYHWTDAIVPYTFSKDTQFTKFQIEYIRLAMQSIEEVSCVRFVARQLEEDYIEISGNNSGCFSAIGKQGGRQILNLQQFDVERGCFKFGTILHELLHVLGFFHTQTSPNRDEFIKINWENIKPNKENNFKLIDFTIATTFQQKYDYNSLMHYSKFAWSKNGLETITPLKFHRAKLGQRVRLSRGDIIRIRNMYKCNSYV